MAVTWRGAIPAPMAEVKQGDALDLDATAHHIGRWLAGGCECVVMLGTLGENSSPGADEKERAALAAVGWVSGMANCFRREVAHLFRLAARGRVEKALALYRWLMPLLHHDTAVKLVQHIKLANRIAGEGTAWVRSPRLPLIGEGRARIEGIGKQAAQARPPLRAAA